MQKQFYDITPDMLHFYKKKVNGEDLKQFLIEVGSTVSKSRLDNMHHFIMKLNSLNTDEEQRILINKYDNFILREMKLKRNVNVASAELALNEISLNASLGEFLQSMHAENIDDFNKLKIFYYAPTTGLQLIYRKLHVAGQRIDGLSLIYARKIITDDNSRHDTYDIEYNWIEIDVKNEKVTFYLPGENVNKIKDEFASRPRIIIENLQKILASVYNIYLSNEHTDHQLYKMYHRLTSSNEARYSTQIHDKLTKDDFLKKFCAQSLKRIDKSNYNGTVNIESRIQNIFLRVVITDDFDKADCKK